MIRLSHTLSHTLSLSFDLSEPPTAPSPTAPITPAPTPDAQTPPPTPDVETPLPTPGTLPPEPTDPPTTTPGSCEITLDVECFTSDGISCEEGLIVGETQEVVFNYTVTNIGSVNALPQTINSNFTFANFTLSANVNLMGVVLIPDDFYEVAVPVTNITLGDGNPLLGVESLAVAVTDEGSECTALNSLDLDLGGPSSPPSAPTPQDTPAPTPDTQPPPPTNMPGSLECVLGLVVDCFSSDGRTCEEAFPATFECSDRSTSLSMKYLGGSCSESFNMQTIECTDTASGPDMTNSVYIEVADSQDDALLFSGSVDINGFFTIADGGDELGGAVKITVYDDEASRNVLQVVEFDPSCGSSLGINNVFGASQVVGWINSAQGVIDSTATETFTFNYTISNEGTVGANLQTLVSNFTEGSFAFSQGVNFDGLAVPPGGTLPPLTINVQPVSLDEGRKSFIVNTEVLGLNSVNSECSVTDNSQFFFGYAQPGEDVPTAPPTSVPPTSTPPTSVPPTSTPPTAVGGQTIGEIVRTNANYSKVERYLNFTELLALLDEPDLDSTFFVPDNEAFQFIEDAGLAALLLTGFWIEHTKCVLRGHLVPGVVRSTDLTEGLILPTYEENENLTVTLIPRLKVTSTGRGGNITKVDIEATNGILQEIDRTMLPTCLTKSIGQIKREDPRFTILFELADLVPAVNFTNPIGLTVFAPTDDAFNALGPEVLEALRDPENLEALEAFLLHHEFNGNIYSSGLIPVLPTRSTSLEGTSAYWYLDGETVKINGADIIEVDTLGRNGVFHVIDEVMLPPSIIGLLEDLPVFTVGAFSFTNLLDAIELADLTGALDISNLNNPRLFTVFAPTDAAFANAPAILTKFTQPEWTRTHLREVLLYHAAEGRIPSADVVSSPSIETESGEELTVTVDGDSVKINDADVVTVDHFAYNGVIHGISQVLIPPTLTQNIVEILANDGRFTELVTAVGSADLTDALQGEGPLTVFAPTDAAFAAIDTSELTLEQLTAILLYHVAGENVILENGLSVPTLNGANVLLTITEEERKVNDANIEEDRILASNGIIYVIDAVLLPAAATPAPTPVAVTPSPTPETGPDNCMHSIEVECVNSDGVDCSEAFPESLQCEGQATALSMKYLGGDCDQSFNMQSNLFAACADGRVAGVPNLVDRVFIEVESDNFAVLFRGMVSPGEVYTLTAGGEPLSQGATVSIFQNRTTIRETRLQTARFNPSCVDSVVAIGNKFGANQVVGWENAAQGTVNSTALQTLTFNYGITNTGIVTSNPQFLVANFTDGGPFSLVARVNFTNAVLQPNGSTTVSIPVEGVSLDGRRTIRIETQVVGTNPAGSECSDNDISEIEVGFS